MSVDNEQLQHLLCRWQAVNYCLKSFTTREVEIFTERWTGTERSFKDIGIKLGVTRERVRLVCERVEQSLGKMLLHQDEL